MKPEGEVTAKEQSSRRWGVALVQFAFGQILMPPPIENEDVSMLQTQL